MRHLCASICVAIATTWAGIAAANDRPVVVELFTSQGCSSCPPADALLHDLAKDPDVIALALHVDYWDYIGWKDSFADPAYTERQRNYARAQSERMVYTPQMMINGIEHVIGNRAADVTDAVARHKALPDVLAFSAERSGDRVRLDLTATAAPGPFIVHLISYRPSSEVAISRGENAGKTVHYTNVVTQWRSVLEWDGRQDRAVNVAAPNAPAIAIVQRKGYGEILQAVRLD